MAPSDETPQVGRYLCELDEAGGPCWLGVMLYDNQEMLLAAAAGHIAVWDVAERALLHVEELSKHEMTGELTFPLTLGPSRTFVGSLSPRDCALWSLDNFQVQRSFEGHTTWARDAFCPDDETLISCSGDGRLTRWRIRDGIPLAYGHVHAAERMVADARGARIATVGQLGLDVVSQDTLALLCHHPLAFEREPWNHDVPAHAQALGGTTAAWCSTQSELLVGCCDYVIRRIEADTGMCVRAWPGHTAPIVDILVIPGGKGFMSIAQDATLRLWSLEQFEAIQVVHLPGPVGGACVSRKGCVFIAGSAGDGTVLSVDIPTELRPTHGD